MFGTDVKKKKNIPIKGIKYAQHWFSLWRQARQISLDRGGFPPRATNTEQIGTEQTEL